MSQSRPNISAHLVDGSQKNKKKTFPDMRFFSKCSCRQQKPTTNWTSHSSTIQHTRTYDNWCKCDNSVRNVVHKSVAWHLYPNILSLLEQCAFFAGRSWKGLFFFQNRSINEMNFSERRSFYLAYVKSSHSTYWKMCQRHFKRFIWFYIMEFPSVQLACASVVFFFSDGFFKGNWIGRIS